MYACLQPHFHTGGGGGGGAKLSGSSRGIASAGSNTACPPSLCSACTAGKSMGVTQSEKMAATALRTSCELTFISSTNNLLKGRIPHKREKHENSTQNANQGHLHTSKRSRQKGCVAVRPCMWRQVNSVDG